MVAEAGDDLAGPVEVQEVRVALEQRADLVLVLDQVVLDLLQVGVVERVRVRVAERERDQRDRLLRAVAEGDLPGQARILEQVAVGGDLSGLLRVVDDAARPADVGDHVDLAVDLDPVELADLGEQRVPRLDPARVDRLDQPEGHQARRLLGTGVDHVGLEPSLELRDRFVVVGEVRGADLDVGVRLLEGADHLGEDHVLVAVDRDLTADRTARVSAATGCVLGRRVVTGTGRQDHHGHGERGHQPSVLHVPSPLVELRSPGGAGRVYTG